MTSRPRFAALLALLAMAFSAVLGSAPAATSLAQEARAESAQLTDRDRYIVQLAAPPLTMYAGGLAGLAPTSPAALGLQKVDVTTPASRLYRDYLAAQQTALVVAAEQLLGRQLQVDFHYQVVFNGLALRVLPAEAAAIASLPGVVRIERDQLLELTTDVGPEFIGATTIWDGSQTNGLDGVMGEGVVVGIIDTGINTDHPSFADVGGDNYDHTNPRLRHYGACAPLNPVLCNDKLIGLYDFTGSPALFEDDNGHGSHTAGTVAGNVVQGAVVRGPTASYTRDIAGVAPHANIIAYKACQNFPVTVPVINAAAACLQSATIASTEQATIDQVDVINYSISGGGADPWTQAGELAFLGARAGGVFVAASAGNAGPGPSTLNHSSPWLLNVAASTHTRKISNALVGMTGGSSTPPADIVGKSLAGAYGPAPLVYAGAAPFNNALCGPFPAGTFNGQIVVCDRGTFGRVEKGTNVKNAGGGGMVLVNDAANGASLSGDPHSLPAVHISFGDGEILKAWMASGTGHSGRIAGTSADISPANADIMAGFSSRGPNAGAPGILKPDITGPGVDIMAAYLNGVEYNLISGTSMSSPHLAGSAALLIALHPAWSAAEVQSALMSTAQTSGGRKEDQVTPVDPFDVGAGRVELRRAGRAGLLLNETTANFEQANPELGGDPRSLNIPSMAHEACAGSCSWQRTVTSAAPGSVTWTASVVTPAGLTLTVAPATFTLASGAAQSLTVTADTGNLPIGSWQFARVVLTPSDSSLPATTLPVVVKPAAAGPGGGDDSCVGEVVVTDASGDQNVPTATQMDITSISVVQPFVAGPPILRVTLKVANLAAPLPPNAGWRVEFVGADGAEYFVAMNTDPTGAESYEYGTIDPTLGLSGQGTPVAARYDEDGTITIDTALSVIGGGNLGATLSGFTGVTSQLVGASGNGLLLAVDVTSAGSAYTLDGGASCRPNQAPLAALSATPTSGSAPLQVSFSAATSSDPDVNGAVVSYIFDFGDGSQPVTQSSPMIAHTYTAAGTYQATVEVIDNEGLRSATPAKVTITVTPANTSRPIYAPYIVHNR